LNAVVARNLSFEVAGQRLLSSVNLEIPRGSLCAIAGPSGAGKSTLLKLLCGIKRPSSGQVELLGAPAAAGARAPDLIGYVPQDDIVHRTLSVGDVMRYAAELRLAPANDEERHRRIDEIIDLVGLSDRRRIRVKRLSGGQRKRVSIGVELITQPLVMFLDEPTSGLDPGLEKQLMHTLRRLASDGRTVVVTTHIMENVGIADSMVVINGGFLVYAGPPARALEFFRVTDLRLLFDQLRKMDARVWSQRYERERSGLTPPASQEKP